MATVSKAPRTTTITLASTSAGPFNVGFRVFDDDEVSVYLDGVATADFTLDTDYVAGYDDGATITLDVAQPSGTVIIIDSDLDPSRATDFLNGPNLTQLLNIEQGRIWSAIRDVKRDTKRSARTLTETAAIVPPDVGSSVVTVSSDGAFSTIDFSDLPSIPVFPSRSDLVNLWPAIADSVPIGTVIPAGNESYKKTGSTDIPDLLGLSPFGISYAGHFANETDLLAYAGAEKSYYGGESQTGSLYASLGATDGNILISGSYDEPSLTTDPMSRVERVTSAVSVATPPFVLLSEWTERIVGEANGRHIIGSFYGSCDGGISEEIIGVHGRADVRNGGAGGSLFGLWGIAIAREGSTYDSMTAIELNVTNQVADEGWQGTLHASTTRSVGAIINPDTSGGIGHPISAGVWFARNTTGGGRDTTPGEFLGSYHTGILFDRNAITQTNVAGDNEAIRIRGGEGTNYRHGGLRFGDADMTTPNMTYGIKSLDMTFQNDTFIWMKPGHRVQWGTSSANAKGIWLDANENYLYLGGQNASRAIWPVFPLKVGAPTLASNEILSFAAISNTLVRWYYRGTDGVTRTSDQVFS